jgi:hypothetical protein
MNGWQPGRLTPYVAFDLRTFDPASGIPRQAHRRRVKAVERGRQRCLGCWQPLKFWSPHHPLILGAMRLPGSVTLMAMCFACVGAQPYDQAGALLLEAAVGEHPPSSGRVLTHRL